MIHDRTSFLFFSIFFAKEGYRNGPKLTFSNEGESERFEKLPTENSSKHPSKAHLEN